MYRDNSLMPSETVRLLALGLLAEKDQSYAALASDVRAFIDRVVGPSLDLVAAPLELLKVEGLVEGNGDFELRLTDAGREELETLLSSNVRPQVNDINKLIIALKMRFLHHLSEEGRGAQIEMLQEVLERELARLTDLRSQETAAKGSLRDWLDLEIRLVKERIKWFDGLKA